MSFYLVDATKIGDLFTADVPSGWSGQYDPVTSTYLIKTPNNLSSYRSEVIEIEGIDYPIFEAGISYREGVKVRHKGGYWVNRSASNDLEPGSSGVSEWEKVEPLRDECTKRGLIAEELRSSAWSVGGAG